uniref:G_PROTEIN_RECEP_F1_2 domain-containing protein n=1 Tax=Strongyloides venezuelensis TaxID=75913 RepID=A0A0K0EVN1_STRVS
MTEHYTTISPTMNAILPTTWILTISELIVCIISIFFNCFITAVTYFALPISTTLRRCLAALALNSGALTVIIIARNGFFLYTIHFPNITFSSNLTCKLHEFPLIFTYFQVSIFSFVVGLMAIICKRISYERIHWSNACSLAQTVPIILSLILTLATTVTDDPYNPSPMEQCSITDEGHSTQKIFRIITAFSTFHLMAIIFSNIALINLKSSQHSIYSVIKSMRNVITYTSITYLTGFLLTGCLVVYKYLYGISCTTCFAILFEIAFVIIPIAATVLYPVLCLWLIYPIREAAILLFPIINQIAPDLLPKKQNVNIPLIIIESPSPHPECIDNV